MKTLIATLFILDFSGSMYQKIVDKSKYEVLQTKLSEMSSTYDKDIPIGVYSFGQKGNQSCKNVRFNTMSFGEMPKWIRAQKPGSYSKTPLATAIRQVADVTKQHHLQQVVIITDGADSCGQDPCEALDYLSKVLQAQGTPLLLDLVGYDVKMNSKKLQCPNFKSGALKYRFHQAKSDAELSKQLVKIDKAIKKQKATNILLAGKQKEAVRFLETPRTSSQEIPTLTRSSQQPSPNPNEQAPRTATIGGSASDNPGGVSSAPAPRNLFSGDLKFSEDLLSSVRVINPPDNRIFYAYQKGQLIKKWKGEFAAILPPGEYSVRTVGKDGFTQNLRMKVDAKQNKLIPFHLFLKDPTPHLIVRKTLFPLKIRKKVEDKSDIKLPEKIEGENVIALSEGEWIIDVHFPWWLQKPLQKEIRLSAGEKRTIDFRTVHGEDLKWLKHPKPGRDLAVLLTSEFGEEIRVFVPKDQKKVPLMKTWSHHWIGL